MSSIEGDDLPAALDGQLLEIRNHGVPAHFILAAPIPSAKSPDRRHVIPRECVDAGNTLGDETAVHLPVAVAPTRSRGEVTRQFGLTMRRSELRDPWLVCYVGGPVPKLVLGVAAEQGVKGD